MTESEKGRKSPPPQPPLPDALRRQLGPGLSWILEQRDNPVNLEGLKRFLGFKLFSGRGKPSTARVGSWLFFDLCPLWDAKAGEFPSPYPHLISVAELARLSHVHRRTAERAVRYFTAPKTGRPKAHRVDQERTGKRRPCFYQLRSDICETGPRKAQKDAASSVSAALKPSELVRVHKHGVCAFSAVPPLSIYPPIKTKAVPCAVVSETRNLEGKASTTASKNLDAPRLLETLGACGPRPFHQLPLPKPSIYGNSRALQALSLQGATVLRRLENRRRLTEALSEALRETRSELEPEPVEVLV